MRRSRGLQTAALVVIVYLVAQANVAAGNLTFDERVAAEEALARVRYSHRIDATRPFEQALPRPFLENRVRTYLAQSVLLETRWNTPITAEMLRREWVRMAARTKMPDRLRELFAALDDNPFLIQECLVRPRLVDRLARNRFASDHRIHAAALEEARILRKELSRGPLDPAEDHPRRHVVELLRSHGDAATHGLLRSRVSELGDEEYDLLRGQAPRIPEVVGVVTDERDAYTIGVVLEEELDRVRIAGYTVPKRTWDDWWPEVFDAIDTTQLRAVARGDTTPPDLAQRDDPCDGDSWDDTRMPSLPSRRSDHVTVWTGSEMIVWGGFGVFNWLRSGMRYDPATDSWTATSIVDAPNARTGHAAVWTGDLMVVWGDAEAWADTSSNVTGGRYDPLTDSWTPTSVIGAPTARGWPKAVWTGEVAIFWGGYYKSSAPGACNCCDGGDGVGCDDDICESLVCSADSFCCSVEWDSICDNLAESLCTCCDGPPGAGPVNTGGCYDPATDTWLPVALGGAPERRLGHTMVWTGEDMIVWGGTNDGPIRTGGRYDPATGAWVSLPVSGSPLGRTSHSAVWIGNEMIVWGGKRETTPLMDGGRYDSSSNSWTPVGVDGVPSPRYGHGAVWTGEEMIVWGGRPIESAGNTGGRYDPDTDSWEPTSTTGAPAPRYHNSMVWSDGEVIVWGGTPGTGAGFVEKFDSGGRYDPGTDSWTPTFTTGAPMGRKGHTAVWTSNAMIVWGGGQRGVRRSPFVSTGGVYDPVTDSWTPTSTRNAPEARIGHTAVWSGDEMIVWGGDDEFDPMVTGGRYDPILQLWTPTSLDGADARSEHSAVWTGSKMIVWGGDSYGLSQWNTGNLYDPASDVWTPTSLVGAPLERSHHTAVWTGQRMIVWGGGSQSVGELNSGGTYDPASDTWQATTTSGAPDGRWDHTAVWSGDEMIVWGGNYEQDGSRYDPVSDAWSSVTPFGAPDNNIEHTAVWAGNRMIVWGGWAGPEGGLYDPVADAWEPVNPVGAPADRSGHSAVWTGDVMIVWGGFSVDDLSGSGGIYDPDGQDADGDGSGCEFDCDDSDPTVFGEPLEIEGVRFLSASELGWPSMAATTGESTTYDIVRGSGSGLPVGSGGSEVCVESGYDAPPGVGLDTIELEDLLEPAVGAVFWYLVRATNSCGIGTYGSTSGGEERVTDACP